MSARPARDYAHRKALLATRASLDRMRLTLALREVQAAISPPRSPETIARSRGTASTLVRIRTAIGGHPPPVALAARRDTGAHRISDRAPLASLLKRQ